MSPLAAGMTWPRCAGTPCGGAAPVVFSPTFPEDPAMSITHVSDKSFEQDVLKADKPVLVDYWAPWCGPCKQIAPILEELSRDYDGRVQIAKIDVDDNPETATRYGIRGIPSLLLYKGGEVIATKVGAVSKSQLAQFLDSHL
jgi:thioredoxin 1